MVVLRDAPTVPPPRWGANGPAAAKRRARSRGSRPVPSARPLRRSSSEKWRVEPVPRMSSHFADRLVAQSLDLGRCPSAVRILDGGLHPPDILAPHLVEERNTPSIRGDSTASSLERTEEHQIEGAGSVHIRDDESGLAPLPRLLDISRRPPQDDPLVEQFRKGSGSRTTPSREEHMQTPRVKQVEHGVFRPRRRGQARPIVRSFRSLMATDSAGEGAQIVPA